MEGEGNRKSKVNGTEFHFGKMKKLRRWMHNNVNVFNVTELAYKTG